MENSITKNLFAFLLACTGVIFFSSKAVLAKMVYQYDVDALSVLTLRLLFALPFYLGVFLFSIKDIKHKSLKITDFYKIIGLGMIGYYLASFLDFVGLTYISAGLERLILFVYPTIVLIISAIFLKKKATRTQILAVVITYLGVLLAFYKNTYTGSQDIFLGGILVFGSAVSYAVYLVGTGKLIHRFGTKLFTSIAMTVSAVAAIIHFGIIHGINFFDFPFQVYVLTFLMAIICTVIPSFLITEAIHKIGASNVAVIGSIGPISTIILASIFLSEKVTVFQILGTIVVIGGVLLLAKKKNYTS